MLTIIFGLTSALSLGACDFIGGIISRRTGAIRTTLYVEVVGLVPLFIIVFMLPDLSVMGLQDWFFSLLAGVIGSLGMLSFYKALQDGRMVLAAPLAAITTIVLPVIVGAIRDGLPPFLTALGFVFAMISVWLVSQNSEVGSLKTVTLNELKFPLLAGIGLGSFVILVNLGSKHSVIAPLLAVRIAGSITLIMVSMFTGQLKMPHKSLWTLVILNTILDIVGSGTFILAGQFGRMDIAATLSSGYSGFTVFLAWIILHEKISRTQFVGIILSLLAISFMR